MADEFMEDALMLLLQNYMVKTISIFTILCFITLIVLKIFNIQHISNIYLYLFIIIIVLMLGQCLANKNIVSENDINLFWAVILVWDLTFVAYIFFNIGRYVIRLVK